MKPIHIFSAILAVLIFSQCNLIKNAGAKKKTITIEFNEMYCGGAAPPDELIQEMQKLKPMANREVEVYLNRKPKSKTVIYKTNDKGQITLSSKLGEKLFLNLYPSAELYKIEPLEYDCYKKFITMNLIKIDMTSEEKEIKLTVNLYCNPCIPAAP